MKKHREEKLGELFLFFEVIAAAFVPVGANYGAKLIPQLQFLAYTMLLTSLVLLVTTWWRGEFAQLKQKRFWPWMLIYTSSSTLAYMMIFYSTHYTSSINTTLFSQTEAIYGAFLGWFLLKEHIQVNKLLGVFFLLAANLLVLYNGQLQLNPADIAIASAPLIFVLGNMLAKWLQAEGLSWSVLLLFRMILGGFTMLLIAALVEGLALPPSNLWFFLLWYSFLVFGLGKIFWQLALARLDISKISALAMSYPLLSFLLAHFWLGEVPSSYQWAGIFLSALGIFFLIRTTSKQWINEPVD